MMRRQKALCACVRACGGGVEGGNTSAFSHGSAPEVIAPLAAAMGLVNGYARKAIVFV